MTLFNLVFRMLGIMTLFQGILLDLPLHYWCDLFKPNFNILGFFTLGEWEKCIFVHWKYIEDWTGKDIFMICTLDTKSFYIVSPAVSYLFKCNPQHAHLGWHRVMISTFRKFIYRISANSFGGNYSFLNLALCDLWSQYIKVRKLFLEIQ